MSWKEENEPLELLRKKMGFLIGFEEMIDRLLRLKNTSYPPYNIEKLDSNKFKIILAVAGFRTEEVSVYTENLYLIIEGKKSSEEDSKYLYKGIASRSFQHIFVLSADMKVMEAFLGNGLLNIIIEKVSHLSDRIQIKIHRKDHE